MSKLAFISDIHGNYPALLSVWEDILRHEIDHIYCLGDLVGYYCDINEVINFIRNNNIPCIMGNHDFALAFNNGIITRSTTCTNVLSRQLSYISKDNLDYLKSLPSNFDILEGKLTIKCVHGSINDYIDEYVSEKDLEKLMSRDNLGFTHLITAHTHIPFVKKSKNLIYGNCGSVGQPRDHNPKASYIILNDEKIFIERVSYPIEQTIHSMKEHGFPDYISEVLMRGFRIGESAK